MAIDATFEHDDGYLYNIVYQSAKRFINAVERIKNGTFLNAVDYDKQIVIKANNFQDYKANEYRTGKPKAKKLY
jgi:hypothetical protein